MNRREFLKTCGFATTATVPGLWWLLRSDEKSRDESVAETIQQNSDPKSKEDLPTCKITIDPGHGGFDPGNTSGGIAEKDVALSISQKIQSKVVDYPELEVTLTRQSDKYVQLIDRLRMAEENDSKAYVSIHANSFGDPNVSGIETLLDITRQRGGPSWQLAQGLQEILVSRTRASNRGVKHQHLYTRHTHLPSALLETGFLTSPQERANLTDSTYQQTIAKGILERLQDRFSPRS